MTGEQGGRIVDTLTLRFTGEDENGVSIHELRAAHVAEVLMGLVGITSDFDKAGVFDDEGPSGSEVLVRPAQEGSFLIEVVRVVSENLEVAVAAGTVTGVPSLGSLIWWANRSARAEVKDFAYLENGNVKVTWQDDSAQEVPPAAWAELNKRSRRRKKQLRQIMAPLSDPDITALEVARPDEPDSVAPTVDAPEVFVLARPDYDAVRPDDEIEENRDFFEIEAQMSAIDFDDPTKWRVKTTDRTRAATVEDREFLGRVALGLPIRKSDVFRLHIREDSVRKNGRTRTTWTVLRVVSHRRSTDGDDS